MSRRSLEQNAKITGVDYEPEFHRYSVNGEEWPSVSAIIRPLVEAEYRFAMDTKQLEMRRAAALGSAVALAIDLDLRGTLDENDLDERIIPRFESWRKFRKESGFEMIACEEIVHSERHRYCGRLDLVGSLPKRRRPALIDTKATAAIMRTVRVQTAGYAIALAECSPKGGTAQDYDRFALHLPEPPAPWRLVELSDRADFRVFLARATLFHCWEKS